ncbi:DUF7316 family protein [Nocardia transvalensis]|uniref:DUF7316 family protein n=1 Tax=Nocardia transvalensis TaxID=37333 RepID=UPI001895F666|nr:hypothetical protein [Nocardia transvalensis]MBF6332314.1 hypothetical protein [Nocardia transvalensis]
MSDTPTTQTLTAQQLYEAGFGTKVTDSAGFSWQKGDDDVWEPLTSPGSEGLRSVTLIRRWGPITPYADTSAPTSSGDNGDAETEWGFEFPTGETMWRTTRLSSNTFDLTDALSRKDLADFIIAAYDILKVPDPEKTALLARYRFVTRVRRTTVSEPTIARTLTD